MFDVNPTTVRRIWRRGAVDLTGQITICLGVHQPKKGNCGRNRQHDDLPQRIQTIPQSRRYCFRTFAHLLKSTVLKPALTDFNKVCHLNWAIQHVQDVDCAKFFDPMLDTVHIDKKWFFMTRLRKKVYGAPGEKIKQRSCKSKQHLLKVMFLTAVTRPRWDEDKNE
ncbi:hypothetical protein H310_11770 [Aphanomyces invadans]|uniref:Uncharacterized protein n=1 Tax=Aphanomyces invadans TaxID=157072 RepID=A0A024TMA5_9STRA|nr:hypothetical protein H310_11770 [Aphanomyces invadans]ETV94442.1 hypothetical protein H310_11770 [Aphanomyces invadans]|eukprot:XP_008876757.1 hypothetical protein H310_11770 [Aphanomyces invadans]